MCLLTYFPPQVQPNLLHLFQGSDINDDGHGFAIVDGDRLIIERGMKASEVILAFSRLREAYPDGPAMFHSRFGTDGALSEDNIHPFVLGGDDQTIVAHNGVLPLRPPASDPRSDTRLLADTMIKRFGSPRRHKTQRRLSEWMGKHNKLVILSVNPRFRKQAIIINEDSGMWVDGIWYSNEGYLGYRKHWYQPSTVIGSKTSTLDSRWSADGEWEPTDKDQKTWWEGLRACDFCGCVLNSVDLHEESCSICQTCLICGDDWKDCPGCLSQEEINGSTPSKALVLVGSEATNRGALVSLGSPGYCPNCQAAMWLCSCE